jgi:hypothetical protein
MKEKIYRICTQLNDGQIAVTEATEQLLDLFAVVGRSEQLVCEYCNDDAKPTCCDNCLEGMVNAVQKAN